MTKLVFLALMVVVGATSHSCSTCPFNDKTICQKWDSDMKITKLQTDLSWVLKEIRVLKESNKKKDEKIRQLEKHNFQMETEFKTKYIELKNKFTQADVALKQNGKEIKTEIQKNEKMETEFKDKITELKQSDEKIEGKMKKNDEEIKKQLYQHMSHTWQLKRIDMALPKMTRLRLNKQTPTLTESFPLPLPKRARAILVSMYMHSWYNDHTNRLVGSIGQRGNVNGATQFHQQRAFRHYNSWTQELMVPWTTDGLNLIDLKITESHNDYADYYVTFKVTGYITA